MKHLSKVAATLIMAGLSTAASAAPLNVFNGWTQLAAEDGTYAIGSDAYLNPGYGGQKFDAEYLFYKLEGDTLSVGLQTGFNTLLDGGYKHTDNKWYYAGDLALSFDGNASNYEYAVDFGNKAYEYKNNSSDVPDAISAGVGDTDARGLYSVSAWNNDIAFPISSPYAMDGGSLLVAANGTNYAEGSGANNLVGQLSYYNIFTFDLSSIVGLGQTFNLHAHWTMSCGNDAVDGGAQITRVSEPGTLLLIGLGLLGLGAARRRVKNQ